MSAINPKNVHGIVLALTKNILLQKPTDRKTFSSNFFMGKQGKIGTFATEWWRTWESELACDNLADLIRRSDATLFSGDVSSFSDTIMDVLMELLVEAAFFDFWKVFERKVPTLFDAIASNDKKAFGEKVFAQCVSACKNSVRNWLIVYPLPRFKAPTTKFGFDGLWFLSSSDKATWNSFSAQYPNTELFDIASAQWLDKGSTPSYRAVAPCWVGCETVGTAAGARQEAARRIRTLISILFAIVCRDHHAHLNKSGLEISRHSIQFADGQDKSLGSQFAPIGDMFPPLMDEIVAENAVIQHIGEWYVKADALTAERKQRLRTASQFLHYAILSDQVERFLHFFIALDALFGERGKVESEILNGVDVMFVGDASWRTRCSQLFDLRSELVHGEQSMIADWPVLDKYRRQFHSNPLSDVATIAMKSLREFSSVKPVSVQRSPVHRLTQPLARGLFRIAGRLNRF